MTDASTTAPRRAEPGGHDHRLAAVYYALAVAVLGFYGIRVCPFVASLDWRAVLVTFALGFGVAFALKLLFEERVMPRGAPFTRSVWQFGIDLGLFVAVGVAITLYNHFVLRFPIESGLKVLIGCVMFGIFAGLDNGLRRERSSPGLPAQLTGPPRRIFPITDRLIVIFAGIAVFAGAVAALVVVKDVDYLIAHIDEQSPRALRRAVFIDVGFVVGVVLLLTMRLLWAYGRNLAYMLQLQIAGLEDVSAGKLERYVPVITRDEFSLIAYKTNQMIATLRRAHHEQRELFEVSLALATELRLDPLLARIVATTRGFVEADRVSLFLHDPGSDELWGKVAEGVEQELRFPAGQGIAGHVFRSGETTIVTDAYADPRFSDRFDRETGYRTRSLLSVPVVDRQARTIGVIQALNRTSGEFDANDARRLLAFAAQAAIALVNAQLFADLDRARRYNESILRSLTDGVVTLDPAQRVVKANPAALRILAQDPALQGRPIESAIGAANPWWDRLSREQGESYLADTELVLADGARRSVNLTRVPLSDLEDNAIGAMLVFEDVTEEKRVRSTLSRYLPAQVAEQVLADSGNRLGGASQVATVLFSDIRDFTTISEEIGARATVSMLNEYFSAMVDAIAAHNGILDKYIGDAVMAVFGVPFTGDADADAAVRASLAMIERLDELNRERRRRAQAELVTGIGLSTGEVVAGNIGSPRRMDYTVIGDTVNLASRLEATTKNYGVRLVVSGQTLAALRGTYPGRELDRIQVKGKEVSVTLHQIFAPAERLSAGAIEAFALGRAHYARREFDAAIDCFETVLREAADDTPSRVFIERCVRLRAQAPPPDWNGTWRL